MQASSTLCLWYSTRFSVEYSFTCPKSGFPSIHHNAQVCHEVEVKPRLQPVTDEQFILGSSNTEDRACLDI